MRSTKYAKFEVNLLTLGVLGVVCNCQMSPWKQGQFACETDEDCPSQWSCGDDGFCYEANAYPDQDSAGSGVGSTDEDRGTDDSPCADYDSVTCEGENIIHRNECTGRFEIVEECPKPNGVCESLENGDVVCGCRNHYEGDQCEVCPGKWDGKTGDCDRCQPGFGDVGNNCGTCVRYVAPPMSKSGGAGTDGRTWKSAFASLQAAIDAASLETLAGTLCEVWVAKGIYYIYPESADPKVADTVSLVLAKNVKLFGGFLGQETSRFERNWRQNETIIEGRGEQSQDKQVSHVVTGEDGAVLDGFVIRGGAVKGGHGGGLINDGVSPTISNCTFAENSAVSDRNRPGHGGAIANLDSSPTIENCYFEGNGAQFGGAIYNQNSSTRVINSVFKENNAQEGGAIYQEGGGGNIINSTFYKNITDVGGGAIAVATSTSDAKAVIIRNSLFFGNKPQNIDSHSALLLDVDYSLVSDWSGGEHNISGDPLFADENLQLLSASPCIDAAEGVLAPTTDIWGRPRYDHPDRENRFSCTPLLETECFPFADIGAYEYQP